MMIAEPRTVSEDPVHRLTGSESMPALCAVYPPNIMSEYCVAAKRERREEVGGVGGEMGGAKHQEKDGEAIRGRHKEEAAL